MFNGVLTFFPSFLSFLCPSCPAGSFSTNMVPLHFRRIFHVIFDKLSYIFYIDFCLYRCVLQSISCVHRWCVPICVTHLMRDAYNAWHCFYIIDCLHNPGLNPIIPSGIFDLLISLFFPLDLRRTLLSN